MADTSEKDEPDAAAQGSADINRIMELLPHRYPFLLIDRVEQIVSRTSAVGIKSVTINEPFFQGHFPDWPVMPGVLIIESMAQTAGALVMHSIGDARTDEVVYFMTIDKARFRKPVVPGDQLRILVTVQRNRGQVWRFFGEAQVDGETAAEAEFSAMIVRPNENKNPAADS